MTKGFRCANVSAIGPGGVVLFGSGESSNGRMKGGGIVNLSPGEASDCLHSVGDISHGVSLNYIHTYTYIH